MEPADSDTAPVMPVADLLLKYYGQKVLTRQFRLLHSRIQAKHYPLILQNRLIEAETAVEGLRAALALAGEDQPDIQSPNYSIAWAVKRDPSGTLDVWEAGLDCLYPCESE